MMMFGYDFLHWLKRNEYTSRSSFTYKVLSYTEPAVGLHV